ncbi:hypothetical protein ACCO45_008638 [Purpureocillium lilacinum]|uniref:Uncharacterized protein n=1 Tax=Purpureocillium lilacinum TaxID=33203 RepID=A0ACC4DNV7_PURLI
MHDSIFVMDQVNNPAGPRQPGFLPGTAPDGNGPNLHPVAHASLYDEDDDPEGPCRCCGLRPPPHVKKLTVVAGKEDGFVTVGDYVAAVHPWLMSLRSHFLQINAGGREPWPEDTKLMVSFPYPDDVAVEKESTWISSQRMRVVGRQRRAEEAQWSRQ